MADVNGGFDLPEVATAKNEAMRAVVDSISDRFPDSIDLTVELFNDQRDMICLTHITFTTKDQPQQ